MMSKEAHRNFFSDDRGAVAATYALALVPILAILGLGFDYARVAGMDTELQNAADQAALAAATQLDGSNGSMQRAINAATGNLVANSTILSNDGTGQTIAISDTDTQVVFYSNKADAEAGTNSFTDVTKYSDARFVQVTVDTRDANYAFTPLVGAVAGSLNAAAVAGMGSALCRIPPLMVCNPEEATDASTPTPFNPDNYKGIGLLAKPGGGSQWTPGNYGYLDVGTNGAVGVRQALGGDPDGNCLSQSGVDPDEPATVDTQTGNIASGPQSLNTRFDVYSSQGCVSGATCRPSLNSRKDLVRPANLAPATGNSCDIHNNGWREPTNAYHPTDGAIDLADTVAVDSMGHPRDKCHAVLDGATNNCRTEPFGDGEWDRNAYFRIHHGTTGTNWQALFTATDVTKFQSSPSIAAVTRFDVYKWEERSPSARLYDTPVGATGSQLVTRNQPVCGASYGFSTASDPTDRRRMSVAVVNCYFNEVSGNSTDVPVVTWMDVFLVQPSYDRGSGSDHFTRKDEIYTEIIGKTDISRVGAPIGPTVRRDVPYLVR